MCIITIYKHLCRYSQNLCALKSSVSSYTCQDLALTWHIYPCWQYNDWCTPELASYEVRYWWCHNKCDCIYVLLSLCAGQYGRWSTDSCRVVSDNGATTQCVCTQLGHFSLLFVSDTALTIAWSYSTNHEACVVLSMAWFVWPNYTITLCFRTSTREMCFPHGAIFLAAVTYVGTTISVLCLVVTVITYTAFKYADFQDIDCTVKFQQYLVRTTICCILV